jgi:hypothetical protein
MGRASFARRIWGLGLGFLLLTGLLLSTGCQKSDDLLEPSTAESTILHATYRSTEEFRENPIEMDGAAIDREWGGGTIPYHNVRVSIENGVGWQSAPEFVSIKAVYTDEEIFFLVRWYDPDVDLFENMMEYEGPWFPDSLTDCQPSIVSEANWSRNSMGGEDRFAMAFAAADSTGGSLGSFRDLGCLTACHAQESPAFGRVSYGRLDVWQWFAGRTNLVVDLFDLNDNPEEPLYGWPGYLDDLLTDPFAGLSADPGSPCYRPNFLPGSDVPLYVYRELDDPYANPIDPDRCTNLRDDRCIKNNGIPSAFIWRDELETFVEPFGPCDIRFPDNGLRDAAADTVLNWLPGDMVSGYILTYPSGSRGDVHGKAGYEGRVWILEIGRLLDTGDPLHDVIFDPDSGREYTFTIAVADYTMRQHLGSAPQILVFDPPPERR